VFATMGIVAIYFYRIDSNMVARITQELLGRHGEADQAGEEPATTGPDS
jgi:Na+/melibiose symporter-like transporter